MKKEKKVFFSAFAKTDTYRNNTKLLYDSDSIEFVTNTGEEFNLRFKNCLEEIYKISDGILIKFHCKSENLDFFNKSSSISEIKYNYYILTVHPLNNIFPLIGNQEGSLNIIKTSKKFPFVISKSHEKLNFYFLLFKEKREDNFQMHLQKITLNNSPNNFFDENFIIPKNEEKFNILFCGDLQLEHGFKMDCIKIKIYTSFFDKNSVYFSIMNKTDSTIIIVKFKFKPEDLFLYKKTVYVFHDVLDYCLIDSLISVRNVNELFSSSKVINQNVVLNFLKNKDDYGIKNNTLCYIEKNKTLNYVEGSHTILKITNIIPLFSSKLSSFEMISLSVKNNNSYSINKDEVKFNLDYYLNSELIKTYLEFFLKFSKDMNHKETKNIGIKIIRNFYEINSNMMGNQSSNLFLEYILMIIYKMTKQNTENINDKNKFGNISRNDNNIPIKAKMFKNLHLLNLNSISTLGEEVDKFENIKNDISNKNEDSKSCDNKMNSSQTSFNDYIFNLNNFEDLENLLDLNILDYFQNYQHILIPSLVHFSIVYFENLNLFNYTCNGVNNIILNFALKIITICNRKDLLFFYTKTLYENYGSESLIQYIFKHPSGDEKLMIRNVLFPDESYTPFIKFCKDLIFTDVELLIKSQYLKNKSKLKLYESIYFKNMKNLITILCHLRKIQIPHEIMQFNNTSIFLSREYNLFLRRKKNELVINCNNFLSSLINSNLDIENIKNMHPIIKTLLLSELSRAKENPYSYLTSDSFYNSKILKLIDRGDLLSNCFKNEIKVNNFKKIHSSNDRENKKANLISQDIEFLDQIHGSKSDFYNNNKIFYKNINMTNSKFHSDTRLKEALKILNPNRVIKVDFCNLNFISETARLEYEKFNLILKYLIRQYSSTVGNGAMNLNTLENYPKDILHIKPLNLTILTSEEKTMKLDLNSELLKEKDFDFWPDFHNGVAHALSLSSTFFTNKSYIRNWILFNKPNVVSYQHGGFLLGLGLSSQLDSLLTTDIYQYMKTAHEGTTIGILLGRAISKLSSMEESLSRTLCLHISYLIPSSFDLSIPINIQCAASIGLGLLYFETGNRLMTEMLSNQIGKKLSHEKNFNVNHIESYNLCLGMAIGLINLGMGKENNNEDLKLEEKLINWTNGGKKYEILHSSKRERDSQLQHSADPRLFSNNFIPFKKSSQTYAEENEVNVKLTCPAAYACISLIYLQSGNFNLANKIKIPTNITMLDNFKPFNIYLAILTKNLIIWENILPCEAWVMSLIPDFIKFLHEETLASIVKDDTYGLNMNNIEFSLVSASYYYCIAAGVSSLAFKYAGTNNFEVAIIIKIFIKKVKSVKVTNEIIVKEYTKYFDGNKSLLNRNILDQILCILCLSLGIVMSGSGDLDSFKLLRVVRKKIEWDKKSFHYGFNMAIHHAIGLLFLGSGRLTFSSSKKSLAFLYISTFPLFAESPGCNEKYLQALRHFYVLASENKILETRDIETGELLRSSIDLEYNDGRSEVLISPVNIQDFSQIKILKLLSRSHYYLEIKDEDLKILIKSNEKCNRLKNKIIYVKRKNEFEDKIHEMSRKFPLLYKFENQSEILIINNIYECLSQYLNEELKKIFLINTKTNVLGQVVQDFWFINKKNSCSEDPERFLIKSYSLLLMIKYIQKDNINTFMTINDYLFKLDDLLLKKLDLTFESYLIFFFIFKKNNINIMIQPEQDERYVKF
jgi:hypothetical protein